MGSEGTSDSPEVNEAAPDATPEATEPTSEAVPEGAPDPAPAAPAEPNASPVPNAPVIPPLPPRPESMQKADAAAAKHARDVRLAIICGGVALVGVIAVVLALVGGSFGSSSPSIKAAPLPTITAAPADQPLLSAVQTVIPIWVPTATRILTGHGDCNDFAAGISYDQEIVAVSRILRVDAAAAEQFINAAIAAYCPEQASVTASATTGSSGTASPTSTPSGAASSTH